MLKRALLTTILSFCAVGAQAQSYGQYYSYGQVPVQPVCNNGWCTTGTPPNPYAGIPMGQQRLSGNTQQYWMPVPPGQPQAQPHPSRVQVTRGQAAAKAAKYVADIDTQTAAPNSRHRKWDAMVGVSAGAIPEYVGSSQYIGTVLPFVIASYRTGEKSEWRLNPFEGAVYAYKFHKNMEVGINGMIRRGRQAEDDHESLTGMPDIDNTVEVGPWIKWHLGDHTYVRAGLGVDMLDAHGGQVVDMEIGANYPITRRFSTGFAIRGLYGDENYMKTYFNVAANQTRRNRGAYTAGEGLAEVGVRANAQFWVTPKIFTRADVFMNVLQGDAADSTVIRQPETYGGLFTVGYRF